MIHRATSLSLNAFINSPRSRTLHPLSSLFQLFRNPVVLPNLHFYKKPCPYLQNNYNISSKLNYFQYSRVSKVTDVWEFRNITHIYSPKADCVDLYRIILIFDKAKSPRSCLPPLSFPDPYVFFLLTDNSYCLKL